MPACVAFLFAPTPCFDIYGAPAGVAIGSLHSVSLVPSRSLTEDTLVSVKQPAIQSALSSAYNGTDINDIPAECFGVDGMMNVGGPGAGHVELGACRADRSASEMLRICAAICTRVAGCEAVHLHKPLKKDYCRLHMGLAPHCSEYPLRLGCSEREGDEEALGFLCPIEPIDRRKYLPESAAALPLPMPQPSLPISRPILSFAIELLGAPATLGDCPSSGMDVRSAILRALSSSAVDATIRCPGGYPQVDGLMPAGMHLVRYVARVELQPREIDYAIAMIDTAHCTARVQGTQVDGCGEADDQSVLSLRGALLNASSARNATLWSLSQTTWAAEGYRTSVVQDIPSCIGSDGQLAALRLGPVNAAVFYGGNVQFAPEDHESPPLFVRSMASPSTDAFPIPEGCFRDTRAGSPSDPALVQHGKHYELLGDDCVGNRTQEEMLRICMTICMHVDFGGPGDVDARCVAVNYDEHGERNKGHCHLQSASRLTSYRESACASGQRRNGVCVENAPLTPRATCADNDILRGLDHCGRRNQVGLFCHFASENDTGPSPGRRCALGSGYDDTTQACSICEAGSYSSPELDLNLDRSVVPRPLDFPSTVNYCHPCPAGRFCQRGVGCRYGDEATTCPLQCPSGHSCPQGASTPTPCASQEYQDEPGQSECKRCPTEFGLSEGAESLASCMCPEGERRLSLSSLNQSEPAQQGEGPCVDCDDGMNCDWTTSAYISSNATASRADQINLKSNFQTVPLVQAGYWASAEAPLIVFVCDARRTHPDCLGGAVGSSSLGSDNLCGNGREGPLCALCPEGSIAVAEEGGCEECDIGSDVARLVAFVAALLVVLYILHRLCNRPGATEMLSRLASVYTLGQLVEFCQALCAFYLVQLEWGPPFSSMVALLRELTFNFELVRFSCFVNDQPVLKLMSKVLAPIALVLTFGLVALFDRWLRPSAAHSADAWLNCVGLLIYCLYTSLALAALSPFLCFAQLGGQQTSLYDAPEVICWESAQHRQMVVIGAVAVALYPVALLFLCVGCVTKYKRWLLLSSPKFGRYKFLFSRWRTDRYYYQIVRLMRSLAIAAIPTLIPHRLPDVQISLLSLVLSISLALQLSLWPWRVDALNVLDAGLTMVLLWLLSIMGTSLGSSGVSPEQSVLTTVVTCVSVGTGLSFALWQWRQSFGARAKSYTFFLSHHKGGAGNTARLIKLLLTRHARGPIFFDTDNLTTLDLLFDAVRASRKMVLILSGETTSRPWCLGEIVVAHLNKIPILPIVLPSTAALPADAAGIDPSDVACELLAPYGITREQICAALEHVLREVPRYECQSAAEAVERVVAVAEEESSTKPLPSLYQGQSSGLRDIRDFIARQAARASSFSPMRRGGGGRIRDRYLVVGDGSTLEAMSANTYTQMALQDILQERVRACTGCTISAATLQILARSSVASPTFAIITLTPEVLRSPAFLAHVTLACRASGCVIQPILCTKEFSFPTREWLETFEATGGPLGGSISAVEDQLEACIAPLRAGDAQRRSGSLIMSAERMVCERLTVAEVADALRGLFKRLALPFDINYTSEAVIREHTMMLLARLNHLKRDEMSERSPFTTRLVESSKSVKTLTSEWSQKSAERLRTVARTKWDQLGLAVRASRVSFRRTPHSSSAVTSGVAVHEAHTTTDVPEVNIVISASTE